MSGPDSPEAPRGERIQKLLSRAGVASRREAERLIQAGRVKLNGEVVTELGTRAGPDDELHVDGLLVDPEPDLRYVVVYKPPGMLCTLADPEGRPTVVGLLPEEWGRIYPVGRLDWSSEGVLLMTNDGELANRMMHPRYGVERVYEVKVEGRVTASDPRLVTMRRGVDIGQGEKGRAKRVEWVGTTSRHTWLRVVLTEGKNREVRRLCQVLELDVLRLKRVAYGPLTLVGLKPGGYRELSPHEVHQLLASLASGGAAPPLDRPPAGKGRGPDKGRPAAKGRPASAKRRPGPAKGRDSGADKGGGGGGRKRGGGRRSTPRKPRGGKG